MYRFWPNEVTKQAKCIIMSFWFLLVIYLFVLTKRKMNMPHD